ncbi:hypothetical protein [Dactylosporangium sp. NPDC049140]|uniref:hypothetical protein n=1 Tax=Dactylosporangium sp. NPDC049140 TaxID=3155647 RepID=UPI0033EBFE81
MYIPSRRHRRQRRGSLLIVAVGCTAAALGLGWIAVGCTAAALGLGWIAVDEARGGTVDAEVVDIQYIASGRRVYDVRFDVAGRICSAQVDSGSNPLPHEVHIGGTSRLRYSASRRAPRCMRPPALVPDRSRSSSRL